MKYTLAIFDLDGTLSDPQIGISRSINHALAAHGYAERDETWLARYIGPPLDESFADLCETRDAAHIQTLVDTYRERYGRIGYAENTLYAGIAESLAALHASGMRLGVCTSKRVDFAHAILKMFDIDHYFDFVSGGDIGIHKWQQLGKLIPGKIDPASAVMIGDRDVDIFAAQRNGLASAGVLWGFGSQEELAGVNPHYLFQHPADLLGLL